MKFSIITVCFNSEKTIEKTINSVLSQKYKNFEYIIVDGGSSDETMNIVEKYKSHLYRIICEKDDGIYDAINKGISISTGNVISIIHSDDHFYNENVLDRVKKNFEDNPKLDCLIGTTLIKNLKSDYIVRKYNPKIFKKWMLYLGFSPPHPSSFIKKKIYDECGNYKKDYEIAGDFEFFLRIFIKYKISLKTIDSTFVVMSSGGKSSYSLKSNIISSKEILKSFKQNKIYTNWLFIIIRFPIKLLQIILK